MAVKLIDPAAHEAMLRLAEAGLIAMPAGDLREVYPAPDAEHATDLSRILRARTLANRAERKLKAAALLEGGGFAEEARGASSGGSPARGRMPGRPGGRIRAGRQEAAAAYLPQHDYGAGGLPTDAVRILSGEAVEAGAGAAASELLDLASRRIEETAAASRRLPSR